MNVRESALSSPVKIYNYTALKSRSISNNIVYIVSITSCHFEYRAQSEQINIRIGATSQHTLTLVITDLDFYNKLY